MLAAFEKAPPSITIVPPTVALPFADKRPSTATLPVNVELLSVPNVTTVLFDSRPPANTLTSPSPEPRNRVDVFAPPSP